MITIISVFDKTELFCKIVFDMNVSHGRDLMEEAKRKNDEEMTSFEEKSVAGVNEYISKMKKKAEKDSAALISKAKIDSAKNILAEKSRLIAEFYDYLYEEINKYRLTSEYMKFFKTTLDNALEKFTDKDDIKIFILEEDKNLIGDKNIEIQFTDEISGGFIILQNDSVRFNYSVDSRLDECSQHINFLLNKIMENNSR